MKWVLQAGYPSYCPVNSVKALQTTEAIYGKSLWHWTSSFSVPPADPLKIPQSSC